MSDKLQVVITGSNGVSRVFKEITSDAQRMGQGVEQASATASSSMEKWSGAAQKAGAALGALAGASILVSGEAEASQQRLVGAFENANLALSDFEDTIDRISSRGLALGFDDEDVADSIARLVNVTQDADRAFYDLAIAQDIARGANISLAAATQIVAQTEAGRYRSMAQLGIVLEEGATATDYLTAAQERYNGAAERFATTGAADFARWQNTAENALEAVGAKLSSIQGPLLAVSAGSTVLGTVGGLLKDVGAGSALATVALGPVGLTAAALAAGAGLLYLATRGEEWVDVANTAAIATDNLDNFFSSLAATLDPFRADIIGDLNDQLNQLISDAAQRQSDLEKLLAFQEFVTAAGVAYTEIEGQVAKVTGLTDAQLEWIDTNKDLVISIEEIDAAVALFQGNLDRLNVEQVEAVQTAITSLLTRPNVDVVRASEDIQTWIDQLNQGVISGDEFVAKVEYAASHFGDYVDATKEATEAQRAFNLQMAAASEAMNVQAGDLDRLLEPGRLRDAAELYNALRTLAATVTETKGATRESMIAAAEQNAALSTLAGTLTVVEAETAAAVIPTTDYTGALDAQLQKVEDIESALADYAQALGQVPAIADTNAARLGANASAAGAALGDAFRVAVGNTDAIGGHSQQIADWATELINVRNEYGKIDDLLARGIINQKDYNAAQDAGTRIFAANAAIQDDILEIQTKQAPVLAALTEEQQRYMDHLADLPAEQQAVRLAYMDTATAQKAQEAVALAAAAANGELGEAGEEAAQKLIAGAAEADPYLRAILEDMKLIKVNKDTGEITVDFSTVDDAGASLQDVVDVLIDLKDLIEDILQVKVEADVQQALGDIGSVSAAVLELDDTSATVDIGANTSPFYADLASLGIGGSIGTVFVDVAQRTAWERFAHGGIVPAAHGIASGMGRDVLVGEFGPEIARLPGGSFVLPTGASRSAMAAGGLGGAPTIELHFHAGGSIVGVPEITELVSREMVPALVLALEQYYAGMGVK